MTHSSYADSKRETWEAFREKNDSFLHTRLIREFLEDTVHQQLLKQALNEDATWAHKAVDLSFKRYYQDVIWRSYMLKTLHWESVRYDRYHRRRQQRTPLSDQEELFEEAGSFYSCPSAKSLEEELRHYPVWLGFRSLTPYQQWIFSKKYSCGWKDTDIASHLQISRQAVSNAHRKGLKTLRFYAGEREEQ